MFEVLEKDGNLVPVHSQGDLEYMLRRGWKIRPKEIIPVAAIETPKKQRGRPPKVKHDNSPSNHK